MRVIYAKKPCGMSLIVTTTTTNMLKNIFTVVETHQYHQFIVSFIASIGMINNGMQVSWASPAITILRSNNTPIKITKNDEPWLESVVLLAGVVGVPLSPLLVEQIGRKKSLLIGCVSFLTSWFFIGLANHKVYLYIGLIIGGTTSDLLFVVVPMYICEIADKEIRGFMSTLIPLMVAIGIILTYSVNPFVPFYVPSIIGIVLATCNFVALLFIPESPYYLRKKKKYQYADKILKKLGKQSFEIQDIRNQKFDKFCTKSTMKALFFVTVLTTSQHFCGLSVILSNLHTILQKADSIYLDPNTTGILFACLKLSAVIVSSFTVDKYGRKTLLICSGTFITLTTLGMGVFFQLKSLNFDYKSISWIPGLLVMIYAVMYDIGLGVVPKVMTAELFSPKFRPVGLSYSDFVYVITGTLSILFYNYLINVYEIYVPFYIFGSISIVVVVFVAFAVLETKGMSLQEIQNALEK